MKSVEESVVWAMDGTDEALYPYLPYILQDLWEIGAVPETIIKLIKKHGANYPELNVLDLGCGKGAVSVRVSKVLGCRCHGIDAVPEFIEFARQKAAEFQVGHLCNFEVGDIRLKVKTLSAYDVIILGAIGPVFGDYYSTLSVLKQCMGENGFVIIDDGYIEEDSDYCKPDLFRMPAILQQVQKAGMEVVENDVMERDDIKESNDFIFEKLKRRCHELIEKFPDKRTLFLGYIREQEHENYVLEKKITGTTLVIRKNNGSAAGSHRSV